MAALERFFHKLEFLLKEGYLPRMKDVIGARLPAELKGLKDFLNNSSLKAAEPHYLQRNETERYRFSWNNESKLIVTREVFHASLAGARSGYACAGGWRAQETTENVDAALVRQALNGNQETEKTSLSGPAQTQPVTDQSEPVVIDDTASSAGRVDTAPPRADQNEAEQTASAEQPEVTGAEAPQADLEAAASVEQPEMTSETLENIKEYCAIKEKLYFTKEVKAIWSACLSAREKISSADISLKALTSKSDKELYKQDLQESLSEVNQALSLINTENASDYLYSAFAVNDLSHIHESMEKYLSRKIGSELSPVLSNRDKEVVFKYSDGTCITLNKKRKRYPSRVIGTVFNEEIKMIKWGLNPRRVWACSLAPSEMHTLHIKYVSISVQKPGEEEVNWLIHRDALSWWQTNDEKESHANKDADKEKLKADLQKQKGDLKERLRSIDSWDEKSEQKCREFYKQRTSIAEKVICDNEQRLKALQTRLIAKDETLLKQELTMILKTKLDTYLEKEQELIINSLEEQLRHQEKILEQQGVSVSDLREYPLNSY